MAGGGRLPDGFKSIEELVILFWIYSQLYDVAGLVGTFE